MRLQLDLTSRPNYSQEYLQLQQKFGVPLHGLTAEQIRFFHYAFRNEINVFFRPCDLTGEKIISQFPAGGPFKIFRHDLWWSNDFEVAASDYDPTRPFFEQFRNLQLQVPRMSIAGDSTLENSSFSNASNRCKNCYMVFGTGDCEDCFYTINTERSLTTMDVSIVSDCELCYEVVSSRNCYNLDFSALCIECSDAQFLYDCRRCKDCFLCVGLVGKQYCFQNRQLTADAYRLEVAKHLPLSNEAVDRFNSELAQMRETHLHKYANITGSENCSGNDVSFSQNCINSYIVEHSRDCINSTVLRKCKDCLDFDLWGDPGELCYNSMSCGYHVYNLRMCFSCWNNCSNLTYCDSCPGCNHCFGCVGLKQRKFCVLNKQYTEAEYFRLVERVVADMSRDGTWGKFFPPACSPYALNNSMAFEYFHVTKELAHSLGFEWMDKSSEAKYDPALVFRGPAHSRSVESSDLAGKVLICKESGRPFNVAVRELQILQQKNLPLPNRHWRQRLDDRAERYIFPWQTKVRKTEDTAHVFASPVPERYRIREAALE